MTHTYLVNFYDVSGKIVKWGINFRFIVSDLRLVGRFYHPTSQVPTQFLFVVYILGFGLPLVVFTIQHTRHLLNFWFIESILKNWCCWSFLPSNKLKVDLVKTCLKTSHKPWVAIFSGESSLSASPLSHYKDHHSLCQKTFFDMLAVLSIQHMASRWSFYISNKSLFFVFV